MGTTGQSITLANSIIGVGILAMPFCFQQCGVLLAALILILMGLISRLCSFHVFGSAGKLAVELGIIGFLMGTCIAYFVVVGDLGPQIVSKMFNINQSDILSGVGAAVRHVAPAHGAVETCRGAAVRAHLLHGALLPDVSKRRRCCRPARGACAWSCGDLPGCCSACPSSPWRSSARPASVLPSGTWRLRMELWRPAGVLQCVPIFSMALFCQTQLFEIFESLPYLSMEKMNVVTKNAINICTCATS
ncbi:Uncharacterized protein OBRU01_19477 [Operophtera brumata]|uniref:Uncharacterized protein n=1 Tax=Operophtera brumata TaxID=104452 RepID=A0A0L7KRG8_OPEBR|nr:Uncharacterized protein OBRU01_19477 [Operophtera brumata]